MLGIFCRQQDKEKVRGIIESDEEMLTHSICLAEIKKKYLTRRSKIIRLDIPIALLAAELSFKYKLYMIDSLVYACALLAKTIMFESRIFILFKKPKHLNTIVSNSIHMYQKRNKELEIIDLFRGNYKARFYLREISKLSKLPLKTCQNVLTILEKNKILKSKIEGKNRYFSLNLDNIKTKFYLLQAEIHKTDIFIEKYAEFKIFLKSLKTTAPIIVFGSFAKFRADKNSDLDILVISEKEIKLPFHLVHFKYHQIKLTEKTFLKALKEQENLIKEIEENHVILNNHSFYVNTMWGQYGK